MVVYFALFLGFCKEERQMQPKIRHFFKLHLYYLIKSVYDPPWMTIKAFFYLIAAALTFVCGKVFALNLLG